MHDCLADRWNYTVNWMLPSMANEPAPPTPEPAEPGRTPQPSPRPAEVPVQEPPNPPDERPLIDPVPPDKDLPRM